MYFIALATDYDGTLAHDGIVAEKTLAALERFKKSGRKLILVTGRELPDLKRVFPELGVFDKVVAENGALIYTPASEEERAISPAPAGRIRSISWSRTSQVSAVFILRRLPSNLSCETSCRPCLGTIPDWWSSCQGISAIYLFRC